ncbi:hypothetical protein CISIN_1g011339mg [Citrus sinensis]|uniref:Glycosyltransferase N-terminal domain-containing protein n=1 Tax=Citrus sinensis TaxID=2711 RepID=A0A067EF50_CITSI|nr:hypothetical protein CISIN_1g011339mg [Citrus sinensis]
MASEGSCQQPHFVLFPFLAQGHMIPMIDTARLLAQHGAAITIVTTPANAARFKTVVARAMQSGLPLQLIEIQFPYQEAGVPEGCENFDMLHSTDLVSNFFKSLRLLQLPLENLLKELTPKPSCIVSDTCYPWTVDTAARFNIPRISFHGFSCFCLLCLYNLHTSTVQENVTSNSDYLVVPGLPDQIEMTKVREKWKDFGEMVLAADMKSYGIIINTFEELELEYVKECKKTKGGKVWCLGPVSLCNKQDIDKAERGKKAAVDISECLNWLDSWPPNSVVYVCLGSICNLTSSQMIELGLGLEASKKPFIWVIRGGNNTSKEIQEWLLEEKFEERVKGRGILILGWAPQVLILSHPSIGGFLTHCSWNSSLEGISAGVPLITWPLYGDQFWNEKLIVQVLNIGVRIGVEVPLDFGEEEEIGVLVKKEDVVKAINILMDEGGETDDRRKRAREFQIMAKRATEETRSSSLMIKLLIQDIMQQPHGDDQHI